MPLTACTSVVSDKRDRRCLCAHLYLLGSLHPSLSLTRERSKCEARCRRDRPNHACRARRARVVSGTRDRRCLCAHLYSLDNLHPLLSLTRERSKCEARCRRDRPNHACRARRASVVSDTGDRRCLCAHLLARHSLHPLLSLTRKRSKCEARCLEITLTTHAARRASVEWATHAKEHASARIYLLGSLHLLLAYSREK
jgi:hypothetical protein